MITCIKTLLINLVIIFIILTIKFLINIHQIHQNMKNYQIGWGLWVKMTKKDYST